MSDDKIERLHRPIWRGKWRTFVGAIAGVVLWCVLFVRLAKAYAPLDRSWGPLYGLILLVGGWASLIIGATAGARGNRLRCAACRASISEERAVENGRCLNCGDTLSVERLIRW